MNFKFKRGDKVIIIGIPEIAGTLTIDDIGTTHTVTGVFPLIGEPFVEYILDDNYYGANFTDDTLKHAKSNWWEKLK